MAKTSNINRRTRTKVLHVTRLVSTGARQPRFCQSCLNPFPTKAELNEHTKACLGSPCNRIPDTSPPQSHFVDLMELDHLLEEEISDNEEETIEDEE
ncbi:unnamed protein product [Rhizopus stolonifer]